MTPGAGARPFAVLAGTMVVAGGLTAAVNSAAPFEHGSWLAAYLVLVAGASQWALGVGSTALPAPRRSARLTRLELVLWNAGNGAVMAGVLVDASTLVMAGSLALLVALGCFAVGAGARRSAGWSRLLLYRGLIAVLAVSVVIGSALAGAPPGGVA